MIESPRTPSLSLRQAIGILAIIFSILWFIGVLANVLRTIISVFYNVPGYKITNLPMIVGTTLGILFVSIIGIVIFIIGIWLLRDRKGMYIRLLKN